MKAKLSGGNLSRQPIAKALDYPVDHTSVIHPRLAIALRDERRDKRHLRVLEPNQSAHVRQQVKQSRTRQSMGLEPSSARQRRCRRNWLGREAQ